MTDQPDHSDNPLASAEQVLLARLLELVDQRSPWNRALWQVGSTTAIRECLEYDDLVRTGAVTSTEGLDYVTRTTKIQIEKDPGCGTLAVRTLVGNKLAGRASGSRKHLPEEAHQSLDQLADRINRGYLRHWAETLEQGHIGLANGAVVAVEQAARSIASHLFDAGMSGHHLHGWLLAIRGRAAEDAQRCKQELLTFLSDAEAAIAGPAPSWRVLILFKKLPPSLASNLTSDYLSPGDLNSWCQRNGLPPVRRGLSGLWVRVFARDEHSAVAEADTLVRRLAARVRVGGDLVEPSGDVAIDGRSAWRPLQAWQPIAKIPAIVRHEMAAAHLQTPGTGTRLDDALELLSVLGESTSWATVASAWAAVESLLASQGGKPVTAADRLAAVITCSYPRAELTGLAKLWAAHGDDHLATKLPQAQNSNVRLGLLHQYLLRQSVCEPVRRVDPVGAARALQLVRQPKPVLDRVQSYVQAALRRLYNQRNLVMHTATSNSVALPGTLRTAPTLVAAGIDRVVHAAHANPPIPPLGLAARAENELVLLGDDGARASYNLL